jgi:hypothetical protein
VALARNIQALEFIVVLMGDDVDPEPDITYYQRLLATDQAEAAELVKARAKKHALPQVYDEILVPALTYANKDRRAGRLTEEEVRFVVSATRDIVADLHRSQGAPTPGTDLQAAHAAGNGETRSMSPARILGVPAVDEADELALLMLQRLLDAAHCEMEIATPMLSSEVVALVGVRRPTLVCIAALPPGGAAQTRYLIKRLRSGFPDIKILVGRWGLKGSADAAQEFLAVGADRVSVSLRETAVQVSELLPILAATRDTESGLDPFPLRAASSLTPSLPK